MLAVYYEHIVILYCHHRQEQGCPKNDSTPPFCRD